MKSASNRSEKQDAIPLYDSMDTLGVQLAWIFGSYVITYSDYFWFAPFCFHFKTLHFIVYYGKICGLNRLTR